MTPNIHDTVAIAAALHSGQVDKAGVPYIAHPLAVMRLVPEPMRHVALLHDVIEDCGVTLGNLRDMRYPDDVLRSVDLLTRRKDEPYESFIERIATSGDLTAMTVKMADLTDNMDPRRGEIPLSLRHRYERAYEALDRVLRERMGAK
jgi:(p)ppGpp synthase/HD superfamily hydrolase